MTINDKFNNVLDKYFYKYSWYQLAKKDYIIRTLIYAIFGAFITICFAVFNGAYGIIYKSIWYGIFAIYYIILSTQKVLLLIFYRHIYKKYNKDTIILERKKLIIYLLNGILFIPLTITLSIIISIFFTKYNPSTTSTILAIAIATYTFYKITLAIFNIRKANIIKDNILQTLRNINLVEAIISIVLLTNTLITTFGTLKGDMRIITIILGFIACISIFTLSIYMITKASKKLKNN